MSKKVFLLINLFLLNDKISILKINMADPMYNQRSVKVTSKTSPKQHEVKHIKSQTNKCVNKL